MSNIDLRYHCYAMGYSDGEVGAFYDGYEKGKSDEQERIISILTQTIDNEQLLDTLVLRIKEQK